MVALHKHKIVWSVKALQQLEAAYKYIQEDSLQNAIKVRDDIVTAIQKIPDNPEKYAIDKYKLNNDTSYRAFEKHHYRISYRILFDEIRILRIRHTSRKPSSY